MMANTQAGALTRRGFLRTVAGGAAAAAMAPLPFGQATAAPKPRRPNVVFAFSDEHRRQSLSFTELPQVITPNMKAMADQGFSFHQCVSNYPVCSPYRAILMTGRWPYQTGITDNSLLLKPDEVTLGKAFKADGYATGYVGKWHLGGTRAEPYGFDLSMIWTNDNDHWRSVYHPADGAPVKYDGYNAIGMTDQALKFIEEHKAAPFFLMLSWNPPHANFTDAPPERKALYPPGSIPQRPNAADRAEGARGLKGGGLGADSAAYYGYHAHITAIDHELGRLMKKLDDLGLANNTILVYSSDHGSMQGSHGLGGKRQPYEESARIPLLVRWPGVVPAGGRSDALVGSIDFMPTLCALAGLEAPKTCVGLDFSPVLRGGKGPEPTSQFLMHIAKDHASGGQNHPAPLFRGVRTARYTYAVQADKPWLLLDNQADPYQMKNLIDAPDMAAVRADLRKTLAEWLKKAQDPFVLPA
jgi:arylsulfatase A-like enzyme